MAREVSRTSRTGPENPLSAPRRQGVGRRTDQADAARSELHARITRDLHEQRAAGLREEEVCAWLKEDPSWQFNFLASISGVDWLGRAPRFEVVYHLRSLVFNYRIGIKVDVPDDTLSLPSLAGVWRAADWLEREAYDLFGIRFAGHPDLRRIMLPDDWQGHPYRRDYLLAGRAGA